MLAEIISPTATAEDMLLKFYDVQGPITQEYLEALLPFICDEGERSSAERLISDLENLRVANHLARMDVFDLFPSLRMDFAAFVALLEPLSPRL